MSEKEKTIKAWHFCRSDMKTQHTGESIADGETLSVEGGIELCERGLHASLDIFEALTYAPGPILCWVELSGGILHGDDKLCASRRKVLWHMNVDRLLHEFACLCAERALMAAGVNDERSHNAIKVKRLWLQGKATDKELAAARDAAWDAARAAACDSALAAARAAARDSALAAAWYAERDSALAAAWYAARAAAWDAARDSARDAAWAAAWAAARDSETKWQCKTLLALVKEQAKKEGKEI